jgi:hypothetical protein
VRRRRALAAVLALTVALVIVGLFVGCARDHSGRPQNPTGLRSPSAASRVGPGKTPLADAGTPGSAAGTVGAVRTADRALTVALARLLKVHTGDLAVGIIDRTTGVRATYGGWHRFHTASIVKADILAAMLLHHQTMGTPLTASERQLATQMIENSDNDAATDLWNDDDEADGIAAADARLGLGHTAPGEGGYWGLTSTTVGDQLTLLSDLTSVDSPLSAASRSYELGLMRHVEPDQSWGVTAAAAPGTSSAVKNGWLPDPQLWVINSIGVVHYEGQVLLVAILSDDQPTEAVGIAQVEAAASSAAKAVVAARP